MKIVKCCKRLGDNLCDSDGFSIDKDGKVYLNAESMVFFEDVKFCPFCGKRIEVV